MLRTGVADKDLPCPHRMVPTTIGWAGINGVTVVDALADCVAFDDLDTHDGSGGRDLLDRSGNGQC